LDKVPSVTRFTAADPNFIIKAPILLVVIIYTMQNIIN